MNILITKNPEQVYNLLFKAIESVIKNRMEDGAFTDEEEIKDKRYYFSTLEGLECLLIPFVALPKNYLWEPIKTKYPKLKNIIIDDINFILNFNHNQLLPPKEHGYPYFLESGYRKGPPYWTSECASFTLSVLANFLELRRKYNVGLSISKRDVENVIRKNYEWVRRCKTSNQGWSWVHESAEHPWPTWSLLDTFEEILWYPSTKNMIENLKEECEDVVNQIILKFKESPPGEYFKEWEKKVTNGKPYNVETALNLSRLMLAVSLYKQHMDIYSLALMLYKWASEADFSRLNYRYHLSERKNYIVDSSLVPSMLRTLITMAEKLQPKRNDALDEELGHNHEVVLNKVFSKLRESHITHGKYENLWGVRRNSGITYELYFTERTIEALTDFIAHYKDKLPTVEKLIKKTKIKEKKDVKKKAKRTDIPNDIDKYTVWIPQLAEKKRPNELQSYKDWPIEDLLEFYLFRLFNGTLALDGAEWGYKERGKSIPDGRLMMPDTGGQCLYDAKATSGPYEITIDEIRKFIDYAEEGKRKAKVIKKEVQFFLIVANSFKGNLPGRAAQFQAKANLKLVCMNAKDICNFANLARQKTTNPSELQYIKWSHLLSRGTPLISANDYTKTIETLYKDLETLI